MSTFYVLFTLCTSSFLSVCMKKEEPLTRMHTLQRPHGMQKDTDPFSRLNKQYVIVDFLLLCWVLSSAPLFLSLLTLPAQNGPTNRRRHHHPHPHALRARLFLTPKCLTLGLDMALPFMLVGMRRGHPGPVHSPPLLQVIAAATLPLSFSLCSTRLDPPHTSHSRAARTYRSSGPRPRPPRPWARHRPKELGVGRWRACWYR
ncbi:hypothetical protein B0H14DRAFT_3426520 [Mycena olivaceomarginata]|nr:hypothetical protein B0H14DRAFT_3426520 [Mycena olivaceomarginata]